MKIKRTQEEINNLRKKTCREKYGTDSPAQNIDIKNKAKETCLKKYSHICPAQNKNIQDKIQQENEKKYGVKYVVQSTEWIEKNKQQSQIRNYNKIKDKLKNYNIEPLFDIKEYQGNKIKFSGIKYLWKCTKCGNKFEDDIANGTIPRCTSCFPLIIGNSVSEKEIVDWLSHNINLLKIKEKERSLIHPKEIDIYLPDYHLAIELDGLYWHSEIANKKDKNYHLNKTKLCKEKNIQLIHVFEDEWINKQEIVKSMIKAKLNLYDQIIYARKCEIKKVTNIKVIRSFLNENHLQGWVYSKHNYGLYYNDELISLLCFQLKNHYYEMTRFCNKLNYKVTGGFSRLLCAFEKEFNNPKIKTFADLRYSIGDVYLKNNFILDHISEPNYFYTHHQEKYKRYSRIQFQKHKLKSKLKFFDLNLTEWENMQLNGYDRIYDCGNLVFTKN